MLTIIDYNMGNIASIENMLKKVGVKSIVTSNPSVIEDAKKLILPGVGAFDYGMNNLNQLGITEVLKKKILVDKTPLLGICLGMQLLTKGSEEGNLPGLGFINAHTVKFTTEKLAEIKIPHMGWNYIEVNNNSHLFNDIEKEVRYYFVHSYYVKCEETKNVLAYTNYGVKFASVIAENNIFGVQFHPEKSHRYGMHLLKNFVELI